MARLYSSSRQQQHLLGVLVLMLVALGLSVPSVMSLFVRPKSVTQPHPLRLPAADRLGIKSYRGIAHNASSAVPSFALSLDADFGKLDEPTFRALCDAYGGWSAAKSGVKWDEARRYTLLDFLPPLIQATSGLHFQTTRHNLSLPSFISDDVQRRKDQEALVACNCWGCAFEVLRAASDANVTGGMTISTADPMSAWNFFTGPAFELVQSSQYEPLLLENATLRNEKLQAGDTLLIWHQNKGQVLYLDHVAIVLDDDEYYEKSGSGDKVPFRINTWDGVTSNFPPAVFYWEWRRLVKDSAADGTDKSKVCLEPAGETFGLHRLPSSLPLLSELRPDVARNFSVTPQYIDAPADGDEDSIEAHTYTGIITLEELVTNETSGRAMLPETAFSAEAFRLTLPDDIYQEEA